MDVHQLVNIFCDIDDFCNELEQPKLIGKKMNNTNLPVNRVIFSRPFNSEVQFLEIRKSIVE
jgi:hypothetical protein